VTVFKPHEEQVLDLLISSVLASEQIAAIKVKGESIDYHHTGCGYFFSVSHPCLPQNRIVCHTPMVIGNADGIECTFLVFIENGELTIECATAGIDSIPLNFRDLNVRVSAA